MEPMALLLLLLMLGLIFLSVPVPYAIGFSSIVVLLNTFRQTPLVLVQRTFSGLSGFTTLAIPLFILTAEIMNISGITDKLVQCCYAIVGRIRGGIAHVNVLVSMIFAGISGSSSADTAGIGGILIPAMIKKGYAPDFTIAVTAASSTLGEIIPPSIIAVIYAATVGISVGALFLAGLSAGVIIGLVMMLISYVYALKYGYPREAKMGIKKALHTIWVALPPLGTPIILIGGITAGFFTPTEAAVVACVYSLILAACYRSLTLKALWGAVKKTAALTSATTMCIGIAMVFSYMMSVYHVPDAVKGMVLSVADSELPFLLITFVIFMIVGCFMDATPAIIMLAPILAPIGMALGVNMIHMGVVVVVTLSLGLITPPFGLCLLLACKVGHTPLQKVMKPTLVFTAAVVAIILLIIFVPQIVLWIPQTFAPNMM